VPSNKQQEEKKNEEEEESSLLSTGVLYCTVQRATIPDAV
jgi:hypothetical protein